MFFRESWSFFFEASVTELLKPIDRPMTWVVFPFTNDAPTPVYVAFINMCAAPQAENNSVFIG